MTKKIGYINYRTNDKEMYKKDVNDTEYKKIRYIDSNGTMKYYLIREPTKVMKRNGSDQFTKDMIEYREDLQSSLLYTINKNIYSFVNNFVKK